MIARTIAECERPAVKDETKRCVNSVEAMAEFASSILGKTATVSTRQLRLALQAHSSVTIPAEIDRQLVIALAELLLDVALGEAVRGDGDE